MRDAYDKLIAARCRLMTVQPFYGHMCMPVHWIESQMPWRKEEDRKTMGVRVCNNRVECLWYRKFIDKLSLPQLVTVIQHELEHLIRLHCCRVNDRDRDLWNIVADMTVNGKKGMPRVGMFCGDKDEALPFGGNMIWIPDDWPGNETAEFFYAKIQEEACKITGGMLDDHGMWGKSEMSDDEIRQVIKHVVEQAVERSAGNVPGHLIGVIAALSNPIISWRQVLRQFIGRSLGNRRYTYARRDRRIDKFGQPGISRHAAAKASVIVDTSGSISTSDLEQFFGEIEAICYRARVQVLQWDQCFQDFSTRYRRGDWRKIQVKGRGGTAMDQAVLWLEEKGAIGDVCILLTDGHTNWPPPRSFPFLACITTAAQGPDWGTIIRMAS